MSAHELDPDRELIRQRARRKLSKIGVGLIGAVVGAIVGIVGWVLIHRSNTPEITRESIHSAEERWLAKRPPNYDVEVEVFGRQAATYSLQVRQNEVTAMSRNGDPMKRLVDTWTVRGMFNTIKADLDRNDRVASGQTERHIQLVKLRGTFDSTYGFPRRYHRIPLGDEPDIAWQVKSFHVVE